MKLGSMFCVALFGLSLLTACEESSENGSSETYITPVGEVSDAAFYANIIYPSTVASYFHEQSALTSSCKVSYDKASDTFTGTKDIYCILDAQELDMYFHPLDINFNAPRLACPYVGFIPYYYYKLEPSPIALATGTWGLGTLSVDFNATGTISAVSNAGGVMTGPAGSSYSGGTQAVQIVQTGASSYSLRCIFDYSSSGGPNCCEGTINVTVNTPSGSSTTATALNGARTNCLAGAGTEFDRNSQGYITGRLYESGEEGINTEVKFAAPISLKYSSNLYIANYFDPADLDNTGSTFPPSTVPHGAMDPVARGTHAYPTAIENGHDPYIDFSPYYEVLCFDYAREVKARIRILVRPWDTVANFTAKSNPYSSPQMEDEPFPEYRKHDKSVWKDYLQSYPGI